MEAGSGLIILEGPDACGKTVLSQRLLAGDQDGYVHMHWPATAKDPAHEMFLMHKLSLLKAKLRLAKDKQTVIDRHWVSNEIYGPLYRGGSPLSAEARMWDQEVIPDLGGVYVICAPDPDLAVSLQANRGDESYKHYKPKRTEHFHEIARRYRKLWEGDHTMTGTDYASDITRRGGMCTRPNAMLYDIDKHGHDLDGVCWEVGELLRRQAR